MRKSIKIILIFLGIVFLIGILTSYFGRKYLGKLEEIIPPEKLSQLQGISPEQLLKSKEKEEYNEFISPDGKLKMKYLSDWIEIKNEVLEKTIPEEYRERYELKPLFSAQKFKTGGECAQLLISQGSFTAGISFEEIIEEMKESNRQQGWNMELLKSEFKEKEVIFEAKYQKEGRYDVRSKEKIVFGEEKDYLISFITFDKDWGRFIDEANSILNSVQIIQ